MCSASTSRIKPKCSRSSVHAARVTSRSETQPPWKYVKSTIRRLNSLNFDYICNKTLLYFFIMLQNSDCSHNHHLHFGAIVHLHGLPTLSGSADEQTCASLSDPRERGYWHGWLTRHWLAFTILICFWFHNRSIVSCFLFLLILAKWRAHTGELHSSWIILFFD